MIQLVVKPDCTTGLTTSCIHHTTGCQTSLTTGCIVQTGLKVQTPDDADFPNIYVKTYISSHLTFLEDKFL